MRDVDAGSRIDTNGMFETPDPVPFIVDEFCVEDKDDGGKSNDLCEDCGKNRALPEINSTWGDFEGFSEFTPESENFYYTEEELSVVKFDPTQYDNTTSHGADCSEQTEFCTGWDNLFPKAADTKEFENIFKLSFPDTNVEQCDDDVKSLHKLLALPNEESLVSEFIGAQLRTDCGNAERENCVQVYPPAYDWEKSQSCRNLMLLLGIDASKKSAVDASEENDDSIYNEFEAFSGNRTSYSTGDKGLIQTKLHVAPDSKQGCIFSYQLFLKKSAAEATLPFLSLTGNKSFFNINHLRFNF
ncbi:uncharacterized protein CLBA1 [Rhinophrynus dorsalis]